MKTNIVSMLKVVLLGFALLGSAHVFANDSAAKAQSEQQQVQKININTANVTQLTELPGVGPAIAQRIVEFRETHDGYKQVEELMNVKGIGQKTFDRLKPLISI